MAAPKYYRSPEVAKMVNVHHMSLMRWISGKNPRYKAPSKKLGWRRAYLWSEAEVEKLKKWVDENYYLHGTRRVRRGKRLGRN